MDAVVRVAAFLLGSVVVLSVLSSAVRTVLVPRSERPWLSVAVLRPVRSVFWFFGRRASSEESRERILSRFGPTMLMLLPLAWAVGVLVGFVPIYWSLGVEGREALVFSGSSLTTLGFSRPGEMPAILFAFLEALVGLALVALMISFLPTIYGHFSSREKAVAGLEVLAGAPPDPVEMLTRAHRIGIVDQMTDIWVEWQGWMVDVEQSHTNFPALVWFRSPVEQRSWITAAGAVLDGAALAVSTLDWPRQWEAQLFIRSGYVSLRRVADYFDIPYDPDPRPTDPISVSRAEFDEVYGRLTDLGLAVKVDPEQCWEDFAGWRVNYDAVLMGLCGLIEPPAALWSSDRARPVRVPLRLRAVNRSLSSSPERASDP